MIQVENTIRYHSQSMERVYFICIFACCRELFNSSKCIGEGHCTIHHSALEKQRKKANRRFSVVHYKWFQTSQSGNKISNFTMMFGCDPQNGVEADTKFIREFIRHLTSKFDTKQCSCLFPECLGHIENETTKFESVTNNLGRSLKIECQSNRVGFKNLVAIHDGPEPNRNITLAVTEFQRLFNFKIEEVIYISLEEAELLTWQFLKGGQG